MDSGGVEVVHGGDDTTAFRLIGQDRCAAFEDGCAPLLATALRGPVTSAITAERTDYYLNVLYALLLMRREYELEPRHEDLYARVLGPQRMLDPGHGYPPEDCARDLTMLEQWGAVTRITEAKRIRGYKDNRLAQYRYRITEDATAMLEWLEARLAARLQGRVRDSRDRLMDVVGYLREARRVLDAWRKGKRSADAARRAYYLLESVADAVAEISDELLGFRAEMMAFARRAYDVEALREILRWLERYVSVHLTRLNELRAELRDRLHQLGAPRYLRALAECKAEVDAELDVSPRLLRQAGPLRPTDELLAAADRFFRHGGRLTDLCRHIDESARAVVLKMHHHLKELERRNARLDDIRGSIALLARLPAEDVRYGDVLNRIIASAHGRFDRRPATMKHRVAPPAPRKKTETDNRARRTRPLRPKRQSPAEARALRARRIAELRQWLDTRVLAERDGVALSGSGLDRHDDLRYWMDVERARRLGKDTPDFGVTFRDTSGVAVLVTTDDIGGSTAGLEAPEVHIRRGDTDTRHDTSKDTTP